MEQHLALFPLQLVVFPGEQLNLHIFEPRYRQLVNDAEREGIRFGVPTVIGGNLRPIATEVSLTEVATRHSGGESDIRTRGQRIFRIEEFNRQAPGKLYPGGQVRYLPVEEDEEFAANTEILDRVRRIYDRLGIDREVPEDATGFRTYDVGHYVGLTLEQEYDLLCLPAAADRQQFLLDHLEAVSQKTGDPLGIRERARLNGHFKDLKPPKF
jgi:Lon protease-like protein